MLNSTIVFRQQFTIDNHEYIGYIKKSDDETYLYVSKDGEEYYNKIYNGSIDNEYEMLSEIEKIIE